MGCSIVGDKRCCEPICEAHHKKCYVEDCEVTGCNSTVNNERKGCKVNLCNGCKTPVCREHTTLVERKGSGYESWNVFYCGNCCPPMSLSKVNNKNK